MCCKYIAEGDLSAASVCAMWRSIESLSEASSDVVLDLTSVDFIDSQGAGAVVWLIKQLRTRGLMLKVEGLHGQPLRLFTNLHLVPIHGAAG